MTSPRETERRGAAGSGTQQTSSQDNINNFVFVTDGHTLCLQIKLDGMSVIGGCRMHILRFNISSVHCVNPSSE
jgi:hypothetical protein